MLAMGEAKRRTLDDLYARPGTKEKKTSVYKIANAKEIKLRNLIHVRYIQNEDAIALIRDEILKR